MGVPAKGGEGLPGRRIPDFRCLVLAAGGQFAVIGTPDNAFNPPRMALESADQPDRRRIPEFEGLFNKKSPEEVGQLLDEFLLSQSDAESVSSETSKFGKDSGDTTTTSSKSKVDDAFGDLMKA